MFNRKEYMVKWYQSHHKEALEKGKKYRQEHKEQRREGHKKWREENPGKCREYGRKWQVEHKEKVEESNKKYRLKYPERVKESKKKYSSKHPEYIKNYWKTLKGKESKKKYNAKRRHNFGFYPLNKFFKGSNGHHINEEVVIYMPEKLHKSIYHSVTKNINIDKINKVAFEFLNK